MICKYDDEKKQPPATTCTYRSTYNWMLCHKCSHLVFIFPSNEQAHKKSRKKSLLWTCCFDFFCVYFFCSSPCSTRHFCVCSSSHLLFSQCVFHLCIWFFECALCALKWNERARCHRALISIQPEKLHLAKRQFFLVRRSFFRGCRTVFCVEIWQKLNGSSELNWSILHNTARYRLLI